MDPGRAAPARADARRGRARPAAREAHVAGRQRDGRAARGRVRLDAREGRRADAAGRGGGGDADVPRPGCPQRYKVGLVQFNATPSVLAAPDARARRRARRRSHYLQPEAGTAIGDGLALATRLVQRSLAEADVRARGAKEPPARSCCSPTAPRRTAAASRSDGAKLARQAGIPVYTIALGTDGPRAFVPGPGNVLVPVSPRPEADAADRGADERQDVHGRRARSELSGVFERPELEHRPREAQPRDHVVVRSSQRPVSCSRRSCSAACSAARCRTVAEALAASAGEPRASPSRARSRTSRCGARRQEQPVAGLELDRLAVDLERRGAREHDHPLVLLLEVVGRSRRAGRSGSARSPRRRTRGSRSAVSPASGASDASRSRPRKYPPLMRATVAERGGWARLAERPGRSHPSRP